MSLFINNRIIRFFNNFHNSCLWTKHILACMSFCSHYWNSSRLVTFIVSANCSYSVKIRHFILCCTICISSLCRSSYLSISFISAFRTVYLIAYCLWYRLPCNSIRSISWLSTYFWCSHRKWELNSLWFHRVLYLSSTYTSYSESVASCLFR